MIPAIIGAIGARGIVAGAAGAMIGAVAATTFASFVTVPNAIEVAKAEWSAEVARATAEAVLEDTTRAREIEKEAMEAPNEEIRCLVFGDCRGAH